MVQSLPSRTLLKAAGGPSPASLLWTLAFWFLLSLHAAPREGSEEQPFKTLAVLQAGENPHQTAFSSDGRLALIAVAGAGQVAEVDVPLLRVTGTTRVPNSPLGVAFVGGDRFAVSRFRSDRLSIYRLRGWLSGHLETGPSPSMIVGPLAGGHFLVSVEAANQLLVLDLENLEIVESYPTGSVPFTPAATSDGRTILVPNYQDGTVTIVDRTRLSPPTAVRVGQNPSGIAVLPGDEQFVTVLRGENRVVIVDLASRQIVSGVEQGIGESPLAVALAPSSRLAFVNNSGGSDISVIDLTSMRVVARVAVGSHPVSLAVHPDGRSLWVSCEGSHDVFVLEIPGHLPTAQTREILQIEGAAARSTRLDQQLREHCQREIQEFHEFLQEWMAGRIPDREDFSRIENVLAEDFEAVLATGTVIGRQEMLFEIRGAQGRFKDQNLQIRAQSIRCRPLDAQSLIVTYEHLQEVNDERTHRSSTAVLRRRAGVPNSLEWVHLQETEVPSGTPEN